MSTIFELLGDPVDDTGPPVDDSPGQFRQGLRAGLAGATSSLQGFAGGAAEAAGFDDFARERYAAARAAQAEAQANAPRVSSYEDVHDLRSGWDYMTGLLGQSVPQSAVAVGGGLLGRTPVGRMVGATVATTPMEAGDIAMRQQADPAALAATTPGQRFGQQVAGGGVSAGAQSILPGIVAGKIAGPATRGVGASLRAGLTELPGAMALEGSTETLGEAAKQATLMQANPERPWDTQALKESFVGGTVAGGGMHAVGTAGETARAAAASPGNMLSDVASGAKDLAVRGYQAVRGGATAGADAAAAGASKVVADPVGEIQGIYDAGKRQARDLWESMANSEPVEQALAKAGKTAEEIKQLIPQAMTERMQAAQEGAKALWENKGLTEDQRARLGAAMGDLSNSANQAVVAGMKLGTEQGQKLADASKRLYERFAAKVKGTAPATVKKSEDYSGVEKALAAAVVPIIQKHNPQLLTSEKGRKDLGRAMRAVLDSFTKGGEPLSMDDTMELIGAFGNGTTEAVQAAYEAVHGDSADPEEREQFYGKLNELRASAREQDKVLGLMQRSLLPALQETTRTTDIADELKVLRNSMRTLNMDTNEGRFKWGILKGDMELRYGKANTTKVLAALEKETKQEANQLARSGPKVDESEHEAEEGYEPVPDADDIAYEDMSTLADKDMDNAAESLDYGPEDGTLTTRDSAQAKAAMERAVKQNPDRTVRFVKGQQLGENHPRVRAHMNRIMQDLQSEGASPEDALAQAKQQVRELGYVVAEGTRTPGTIHKGNVKRVTIAGDEEAEGGKKAKRSFYDTKAKFKVGNTAFDAIRLTGEMNKQFGTEWTDTDNQSDAHRSGRMFLIGLAALGDHLGQNIEVDDKVVIDHKGTTYGDIKKLDVRTKEDMALDEVRQQLHDLRMQYAATTAMLKDAIAKGDEQLAEDLKQRIAELKEDGKSLLDPIDFARDRELASGEDVVGRGTGRGKASQQQYIEALLHQGRYGVVNPGAQNELVDPSYVDRGVAYVKDKDGNTQKLKKKGLARRPQGAASAYDEDGNLTSAGLDALLQGNNHGGIDIGERSYTDRYSKEEGLSGGEVTAKRGLQAPVGLQVRKLRERIAKIEGLIEGSDNKEGRKLARWRVDQLTKTLRVLEAADARTSVDDESGMGQRKVDPFGNVHMALRGQGEAVVRTAKGVTAASTAAEKIAGTSVDLRGDEKGKVHTNLTGEGRTVRPAYGPDAETKAKSGPLRRTGDVLRDKFEGWLKDPPSAAAKTVAKRGIDLLDNKHLLNDSARKSLASLLSKGKRLSDVASTVNALWDKHGAKIEGRTNDPNADIDQQFGSESYPEFKTKAEVDAWLVRARKRMDELKDMERNLPEDADALPDAQDRALNQLMYFFEKDSIADLGSFYDGVDHSITDDDVRAMLAKAAPEVAAKGPKGEPKSLQSGVSPRRATQQDMQRIRTYIDRVLGPQVTAAMSNIAHAGDYDAANHAMRVSVHALNPTTVAYHEALHGFFAYLIAQGNVEVARAVERAAMSSPIQAQLRRLLANEKDALAQLTDPEEAAAYMYQFWAAGQLKIGDRAKNVFERISDLIHKVLGIWTTDRRAQEILEYFHSGAFQTQGMGQPNAVTRALMESGRNSVLEWVKDKTAPLNEALDALTVAGAQRLRDTGVPALRELANLMKASGRFATDDEGYLPASRRERTRFMNEMGAQLRGYTEAQLADALAAMQSGGGPGAATTPEGRLAARVVAQTLADMLQYMRAAGVDVAKIQPRANYFPRLYDAEYISRHQADFQAVLERHGLTAREAKAITLNLMASNGAEFTVEVDRPGMQFLKPRVLAMIPDAELAPYTRKDLFEIMSSYITQATRRAEWAKRFKDDGKGLTALLDKAKTQGATLDQMDTAGKFVRAVDGTLGDTLSPGARRIMGNVVVYQNWRLLPLAIFSSVVDPMGIIVRGGTVGDAWSTFKRGMREIPKVFKDTYTFDAETQLAETLGVIDDAMLSDTTGQLYTQGMVGDGVRRLNDALFKYNLMEGFNRSMRVGAAQAAIKFLQRHRDGTASPHSARWLAELGLKPGFTMDVNDASVRAAINMWVDGAVLRPDAVDKPIWMNDPHFMLIAHLKQFVYAFQETILKRVFHEYMHGNYAPAMALTAYVPIMIASDAIKALIQGGGELPEWKRKWGPSEYLASGIERAGLLGKTQFQLTDPGMLIGPTGQQLFGAMEAIEGKASAARAAVKALPGSVVYAGWMDKPSE